MLNNNNQTIRYQYSKSESDIKFCESNPINKVLLNNSHYSGLSWHDICSKINNINKELFFDNISTIPEVQLSKAETTSEGNSHFSCFVEHPIANSKKQEIFNYSIKNLNKKLKSKKCRLRKAKISTLKLKVIKVSL